MKRKLSTFCATVCTLLLAAGFLLVFFFAQRAGIKETVKCITGLVYGFVFAPVLHEMGHIAFAGITKMRVVYAKFFCFKLYTKGKKKRFALASPFAADQTQAVPLVGGNMQKRAKLYTLGGLIVEGAVFFLVLAAAIILLVALDKTSYVLWGITPYAGYLFLLNVLPCEYGGGKTDMRVYLGLKKGYAEEKNMLAAMEIQGRLSEGKSFSEIEETYYFDVPQIAEDEPLFAVMLDLRYRYYLEKEDMRNAAICLNRLASVQEYLSDEEMQRLAAELVYMHAVNGNFDAAEESGKCCKEFLQGETATAKRALAAYVAAFGDEGKEERLRALLAQAETALADEPIKGVEKFERILLSQLPSA